MFWWFLRQIPHAARHVSFPAKITMLVGIRGWDWDQMVAHQFIFDHTACCFSQENTVLPLHFQKKGTCRSNRASNSFEAALVFEFHLLFMQVIWGVEPARREVDEQATHGNSMETVHFPHLGYCKNLGKTWLVLVAEY